MIGTLLGWLEKLKRLLKDKNKLCKQYIKNKRKVGDYEKILDTTTNIANNGNFK